MTEEYQVTHVSIEFDDNMDSDAVANDANGEIVRCLEGLIKSIKDYGLLNANGMRLKDTNGNTLGEVVVCSQEVEEDEI